MPSSGPGEIITNSQMTTVMRRVTLSMGAAAVKAMREAAYIGEARAVKSIDEVPQFNSEVKTPPVDLGQMRSSYAVDVVRDGAVLENRAPHAAHQEFGTRPFTPPRAPLMEWAKRKTRGGMMHGPVMPPALGPKGQPKQGPAKPRMFGPRTPQMFGPRVAMTDADVLFQRAFNSIRRRGIIAKGYHAHASGFFGGYVEVALQNQLTAVTK